MPPPGWGRVVVVVLVVEPPWTIVARYVADALQDVAAPRRRQGGQGDDQGEATPFHVSGHQRHEWIIVPRPAKPARQAPGGPAPGAAGNLRTRAAMTARSFS